MSQPRFLYFDLGKVLLHFDHAQMCRQLAELAGVSAEKVRSLIFAGDLMHGAEVGEIQQDELYRRFCTATNSQPSLAEFLHALCAIFALNVDMVPVVTQLAAARQPLGILSNTIDAHWNYISQGRYGMIPRLFDVHALSYQLHAAKPDRAAYVAAAELAGYEPGEIFFVDDRPENVAVRGRQASTPSYLLVCHSSWRICGGAGFGLITSWVALRLARDIVRLTASRKSPPVATIHVCVCCAFRRALEACALVGCRFHCHPLCEPMAPATGPRGDDSS